LTEESNIDGKIVSAKWYNNKNESIETALVNAEVKIELITENISDGSQIKVQIKEKDADVLKILNTTVKENKIKYDKIKLEEEWEDKILLITVQNNVSQPFNGTDFLTVEAQFCDPLDTMKIRKNRASNLYGKVRTKEGVANSKNHQGFDYYAVSGTDIKAVSDGVVKKIVKPSSGDYGIQLVIKIDNSIYYAFYAHLSEIGSGISIDSEVKKGDTIGKTGKTGNASSLTRGDLHLHFECRTEVSPGLGLVGRESPNRIVVTKFYTQNDTVDTNGNYTKNQTNSGVKKVESDGTETLMSIE
ncbi:MAG: M23 family metallopeptidase, partial [Bacteroidales bacterium]|nr:M23 family metallopeptidase [Bacteroidales bacterium]